MEMDERMSKFDEAKAAQAIAEAMSETVAAFGIGFVRNLSFFPSAEYRRADGQTYAEVRPTYQRKEWKKG